MRFIPRLLKTEVLRAARSFPALILTGPRRAGKTTLLRKLFPRASYHLLEDPEVVARIRTDPRGFLEEAGPPAILDEIQNVPELLNYLRARIDLGPSRKGEWLLTGSQEAPLMKGITESMAGRAAVLQLLPFSLEENRNVSLLSGGFPEVLARPRERDLWFRSYLQTYLERDVRAVSSIRDLATFRRFLSLAASLAGKILNKTELASPLGVSVPTITEWLNILETTSQILIVPPFYENFGKRIIKSPKIYFVDSGLLCHLLGIENERALNRSPFLGAVFESFTASEIIKHQINAGRRRELYYFRDRQGLEVDFLVPFGGRKLFLFEAKASKTILPEAALALERLSRSIGKNRAQACLIYRGAPAPKSRPPLSVLRPGIRALSIDQLSQAFSNS